MHLDEHVRVRDTADFCRQLAYLVGSGMGLVPAVATVRSQIQNPELRHVLNSVEGDLRMGRSLHTGFARFPQHFSPFFLTMLHEGERGEAVRDVLLRLADHLDRERFAAMDQNLSRQIVVRPNMSAFIEELRPLMLTLLGLMGGIALTISGLWYASLIDWLPQKYLGPNISLLVGVLLLALVLVFFRYRPPELAYCHFCGAVESPDRRMIHGEGRVSICETCVASNVAALKQEAELQRRPLTPPGTHSTSPHLAEYERLEEAVSQELDIEFYRPDDEA